MEPRSRSDRSFTLSWREWIARRRASPAWNGSSACTGSVATGSGEACWRSRATPRWRATRWRKRSLRSCAEVTRFEIQNAGIWRAAFRISAGELKERRKRVVTTSVGSYDMEEPARDLVVALAALSERQRASVVLHDAAGYSAREVAKIVGSTEAAVRVHLMRGRRRLRELLGEDDDA